MWIKCRIPGTRPTYSPVNFIREHVGHIIFLHFSNALVNMLTKSLLSIMVKSQARYQEFFRAGEVSCNEGTSMNVSCITHTKRARRKNFWVIFSKMLLKQHFK